MSAEIPESVIEELFDDRQRFGSRRDIGDPTGYFTRALRFLQGDQISEVQVTSTSATNYQTLPDEPRAQSACIEVVNGVILFSTAGANPVNLVNHKGNLGTIIYLTGQPSIKGFTFCSSGGFNSTVDVSYYD